MSLKICGHEVRWQKPIKFYTLVKSLCLITAASMTGVSTVSAADFSDIVKKSPSITQASSGDAASRQPLSLNVKKPVMQAASARTQRPAGPPSVSPAMMLALALGYRNIPGPVIRSTAHKVASKPVNTVEQEAMLIEGDRETISSYTSIIPSAGGDVLR